MKRAHPVDLRKAIEAANELVKAGILFVPMPVTSADDRVELTIQMAERLEQLELQVEAEESARPG